MTKLNESYKCGVCGNLVEVVHSSVGKLVCCGKPMELLVEQHDEERYEKHVPVVEVIEKEVEVQHTEINGEGLVKGETEKAEKKPGLGAIYYILIVVVIMTLVFVLILVVRLMKQKQEFRRGK